MNYIEAEISNIYYISSNVIFGWKVTYDYGDYVIVYIEPKNLAFMKQYFMPMKYFKNRGYARFIHKGDLVDFKTKKEAEEFIEQRRLYEL